MARTGLVSARACGQRPVFHSTRQHHLPKEIAQIVSQNEQPQPHLVGVVRPWQRRSRHSPRNHFVARVLRQVGSGTLLFDLLSPEEEQEDECSGHLRFNIGLLEVRLLAATHWGGFATNTKATAAGILWLEYWRRCRLDGGRIVRRQDRCGGLPWRAARPGDGGAPGRGSGQTPSTPGHFQIAAQGLTQPKVPAPLMPRRRDRVSLCFHSRTLIE